MNKKQNQIVLIHISSKIPPHLFDQRMSVTLIEFINQWNPQGAMEQVLLLDKVSHV